MSFSWFPDCQISNGILSSASIGLTREEADVAAKAGLIDPDQKYWWLEDWQKGEREAERDIQEGRISGPFTTAEELIVHLHRQKAHGGFPLKYLPPCRGAPHAHSAAKAPLTPRLW